MRELSGLRTYIESIILDMGAFAVLQWAIRDTTNRLSAIRSDQGVSTQEVATPGAAEEVLTRSAEVVQLFRRPGLSQSATKSLLRKVCRWAHIVERRQL